VTTRGSRRRPAPARKLRAYPIGMIGTSEAAGILGATAVTVRSRIDELGGRKLPDGRLAYPRDLVYTAAGKTPPVEFAWNSASPSPAARTITDPGGGHSKIQLPGGTSRTLNSTSPPSTSPHSDAPWGRVVVVVASIVLLVVWLTRGDNGAVRSPSPVVTATATLRTAVTWTPTGEECSDGWQSPSIGKRGACSHHGGVVSVWVASDGVVLRCWRSSPPRNAQTQAAQLLHAGHYSCV